MDLRIIWDAQDEAFSVIDVDTWRHLTDELASPQIAEAFIEGYTKGEDGFKGVTEQQRVRAALARMEASLNQ